MGSSPTKESTYKLNNSQEPNDLSHERQQRIRTKVRVVTTFNNLKDKRHLTSPPVRHRRSRQDMMDFLETRRRESTVAWTSIRDSLTTGLGGVREDRQEAGGGEVFDDHDRYWDASIENLASSIKTDEACHLCGEPASCEEAHPCRVCSRIFHKSCLEQSGQVEALDLQLVARSFTSRGWSCYICANLGRLLTPPELDTLKTEFDKMDDNQDGRIEKHEYIKYNQDQHRRFVGEALSQEKVSSLEESFDEMDLDKDGRISWAEYVKFGAQDNLRKLSRTDLVKLLAPKEIYKAKERIDTENNNPGCDSLKGLEHIPLKIYVHAHALDIIMRRPNSLHQW